MPHLPDNLVRFYEDSLLWIQTPEEIAAERAYRDAFLDSAREAGTWIRIDYKAIDAAHAARRNIRETAEVLVPSSEYFQQPGLDSFRVAYKRDHLVETASARGRVHGYEFVRQCWEELLKTGVNHHEIAEQINPAMDQDHRRMGSRRHSAEPCRRTSRPRSPCINAALIPAHVSSVPVTLPDLWCGQAPTVALCRDWRLGKAGL